jgi:hypothetical protein
VAFAQEKVGVIYDGKTKQEGRKEKKKLTTENLVNN